MAGKAIDSISLVLTEADTGSVLSNIAFNCFPVLFVSIVNQYPAVEKVRSFFFGVSENMLFFTEKASHAYSLFLLFLNPGDLPDYHCKNYFFMIISVF